MSYDQVEIYMNFQSVYLCLTLLLNWKPGIQLEMDAQVGVLHKIRENVGSKVGTDNAAGTHFKASDLKLRGRFVISDRKVI